MRQDLLHTPTVACSSAALSTGLGIVTRPGGRVWAEGKPNHGATFWPALPTPGGDDG